MKILLPIIICGLFLIFWCVQFFKLMRMKTEDFPSKEDKAIWAAVMIFMNVFGAFVFWIKFGLEAEAEDDLQIDDSKYRGIKDLDDGIYEEAKKKFPDHLKEIDLALKLSMCERVSLEKYYTKKSPSVLLNKYRKGSKDIRPECFGILLAVLVARNMESEIPSQNIEPAIKTPIE